AVVRRPSPRGTVVASTQPIRFSLLSMLVILTWMGIISGLSRSFGPYGFGIGLYICAASWFAISFTETPSFRPLNNKPWTFAVTLPAFVGCAWLHGLVMRGVQSKCISRRIAPRVPIPVVVQPTGNAMQSR